MLWTYISGLEQKGAAAPVSVSNDYSQYLAYYGTESAYFLGQQYEGMLGTMYALYGISQTINMTGNAIRGIVHQRGALRVAIARNNLLSSKIKHLNLSSSERWVKVGRWMSETEYKLMIDDKYIQEGGGGKTDVSTNGYKDFMPTTPKGNIYIEFEVESKNLLQGGKDGWFHTVGPNATKSKLYQLKKQGGKLLPQYRNLSPILHQKK